MFESRRAPQAIQNDMQTNTYDPRQPGATSSLLSCRQGCTTSQSAPCRLHMLHRWRIRYFGPGAIIAAFCSQGPGFRMSPETLPAASLTKAIRV